MPGWMYRSSTRRTRDNVTWRRRNGVLIGSGVSRLCCCRCCAVTAAAAAVAASVGVAVASVLRSKWQLAAELGSGSDVMQSALLLPVLRCLVHKTGTAAARSVAETAAAAAAIVDRPACNGAGSNSSRCNGTGSVHANSCSSGGSYCGSNSARSCSVLALSLLAPMASATGVTASEATVAATPPAAAAAASTGSTSSLVVSPRDVKAA